jgi:hypothetical protein
MCCTTHGKNTFIALYKSSLIYEYTGTSDDQKFQTSLMEAFLVCFAQNT